MAGLELNEVAPGPLLCRGPRRTKPLMVKAIKELAADVVRRRGKGRDRDLQSVVRALGTAKDRVAAVRVLQAAGLNKHQFAGCGSDVRDVMADFQRDGMEHEVACGNCGAVISFRMIPTR